MTTLTVESNTEPLASKETSDKFDVIGHLPADIVQQILFPLPPKDLHSASFCCSRWSAAVRDDYFWKPLCERDGHLEVTESERSEFYNNFLTKYNYWQGVYWYNYTLQRNWETNNFRERTYEINKLSFYVNDLRNFGDVFAFSEIFHYGIYINVYNLKSEKREPTVFPIRNNGVPSTAPRFLTDPTTKLLRSGDYLIYFVRSDIITVWDFVKGTTIFEAHGELYQDVTTVLIDKNLIVLQISYGGFNVFNIKTKEIEYRYKGNFKNIIFKDGKIMFSTNEAINVLKWNDKSIVPLTCCQSRNDRRLLVKNDFLLSFCNTTTVCIWNTTTNTKLHSTFLRPMPNLLGIFLINKYFYVKSYSDIEKTYKIKFWDYMKGTPKVAIVVTFNRNIDSGSNDHFMVIRNTLNIWCLRTKSPIPLIPLSNRTLVPDDQCDIAINETSLTYVSNSLCGRNRMIIHRRDYEI